MTVDDLIERLEAYRDELGGDAEVRLATQQNYPLEANLRGVCSASEIIDSCDEDEQAVNEAVVYLVEGSQVGYGSKVCWEVCQ